MSENTISTNATGLPRRLFLAAGPAAAVFMSLRAVAAARQNGRTNNSRVYAQMGENVAAEESHLLALMAELEKVHARRLEIATLPADDAALNAVLDAEDDKLFQRHWEIREEIHAADAKSLYALKAKARAAQLAIAFDEDVCCSGAGSYLDFTAEIIDRVLAL